MRWRGRGSARAASKGVATCRARGRAAAGALLALALLFALTAWPAWADTPTNEDVPTDETGVVDPSAKDDNDQNTGETEAAPDGTLPGVPLAPDGAATDGLPQGDAPLEGADEPAASEDDGNQPPVKQPAPKLPDPVFGENTSEENRVNPQQKPDSSFIYDTAIADLQEADSYLNDQTVQVTGEVVGDRIKAEFDPGFCWIVLQGDNLNRSEIPVFLALEYTDLIDIYGAYGRKGATLQVRGTFHLTCPEHQGLTDLHADAVSLVEKGSVTEQVFDIGAFLPGIMLVFTGLVMLLVFRHMREGQR